jgi:hypothetical protein
VILSWQITFRHPATKTTIPQRARWIPHRGQDHWVQVRHRHRPVVHPVAAIRGFENEGGVVMKKKRRRGRPPTFLPADRRYLAKLIRKNGIAGAKRRAKFSVGSHTLIKIASEFEIVLPKGRRPKSAA